MTQNDADHMSKDALYSLNSVVKLSWEDAVQNAKDSGQIRNFPVKI
jgi:hypothetical protein